MTMLATMLRPSFSAIRVARTLNSRQPEGGWSRSTRSWSISRAAPSCMTPPYVFLASLGHEDQNLGRRDLGIVNGAGGQDHVRGAGPAPGLGPVALGEDRVEALVKGRGLAQDGPGQDNALPAKTGQPDFRLLGAHFLPFPDEASTVARYWS